MKTKALFLSVLMTCLFLTPAWALITDPEDYVIYDSGYLCEESDFNKPDFFSVTGWQFGLASNGLSGNSSMAEFLHASSTSDPLNAILIGLNDTLVVTLPSCDSIYIEFWGGGMRGLKITNDHNNNYAWSAVNGLRDKGRVGARFDAKDSIRIYLTGTKLEIATPLKETEKVNINRIKIYAGIETGSNPAFVT